MLKNQTFFRNMSLQFFVALCLVCSYPQSMAPCNRHKYRQSLFCARDRGPRHLRPIAGHRCQILYPDVSIFLGTFTFFPVEQPHSLNCFEFINKKTIVDSFSGTGLGLRKELTSKQTENLRKAKMIKQIASKSKSTTTASIALVPTPLYLAG